MDAENVKNLYQDSQVNGGSVSVVKRSSNLCSAVTGIVVVMISALVSLPRLRGMAWPDWEKESYPDAKDLVMIPLFAVLFPTVRYCFDNFILEKLGRRVFYDAKQPFAATVSEDMEEYNRRRLVKFKESAWKGLYYLTAELFALAVTYSEPWFTESKQFWVGPGDQRWPNQMTRLKLKVLYGFAGGFYTYSIFALTFWETRRKDFGVSMSHHVAAVFLIVFSYLARFARVGSVVLAIHDASDVILESAKLSKYLGLEVGASIVFVLFVLSWIVLRLIYFPAFVIWSTSYEVLQLLDRETHPEGPVLYYIFNTLLISLFIMHIYWWVLMWRMIVKQVQDSGSFLMTFALIQKAKMNWIRRIDEKFRAEFFECMKIERSVYKVRTWEFVCPRSVHFREVARFQKEDQSLCKVLQRTSGGWAFKAEHPCCKIKW